MLGFRRVTIQNGLDVAVRDALVASSTPVVSTVSGFLAGILTVVILLPLLFYHACVLQPTAALGHLPDTSPYPTCVSRIATIPLAWLIVWPYLLGVMGGFYGYFRRIDICGEQRWHWNIRTMRPYHVLSLLAGYLIYALTAYITGSSLLITHIPFLALVSGPVLVLLWQFAHNKLLIYVSRPTWENLVAYTARVWFARRLSVPQDTIIQTKAHTSGLLEVYANLQPSAAEEVRCLGVALPGITRVEIFDANGNPIKANTQALQLLSTVQAGRTVAQLRRNRERFFASGAYEKRHDVVHDYSGRLLMATASVVALTMILSMLWIGLKGGFRAITPEELQWFFGRSSSSTSSSGVSDLPGSTQP